MICCLGNQYHRGGQAGRLPMTVDRRPKTDGGLRKRERTKAKSKPNGDLSPAAQAALQDCAKDINERMGGKASPVAAQ